MAPLSVTTVVTCGSHTAHVLYIGWTSVRLSVCPSVRHTLVLCRNGSIVKLSSLSGSPMILVFWEPNFFPEFQWEHPNWGVECKGGRKELQFPTISRYRSLTVEDRWVYMLRGVWQALNSLSIHVTFTAIVPGTYPWESKMWLKKRSFTSFTVENESFATDISLYFRNGWR